ncbi:HK97 family phage prohead protease [Oscillospiraceae bacterium LTW-04]|nr:HK97 family phage prohead protease [Oscillospiraceae bacterium MB24-C1]
MTINVIIGPPCSGKSTYVQERIKEGDIVSDYDRIARALTYDKQHKTEREAIHPYVIEVRMAILRRLNREKDVKNAWIITTNLSDNFKSYLDTMNPNYIEMDVSKEECYKRLAGDDDRPDKEAWRTKIDEWFKAHESVQKQEGRSNLVTKDRQHRTFEIRAAADGMTVEGYAATFEQPTVLYEYDGIKYYEVISRGAFTGAQMSDVMMNFNHRGKPVARTKNGTLTLEVDDYGLKIKADLSGTEEGRRLYEEVKGGYIDKMSFTFKADPNRDSYDRLTHTRRISGFERIYDVAAVDIPAYDSTSISARSFFEAQAEAEAAEVIQHRNAAKRLILNLTTEGF